MGRFDLNHLKLLHQHSGFTVKFDKYFGNKLSCRSMLHFSLFHQSTNSVNYSTNYDQYRIYKAKKVVSPESEKAEPIFQYARDKCKQSNRIYIWGNASLGALGIKEYVLGIKNKAPMDVQLRPAKLPFIEDYEVTKMACGYGFTVMSAHGRRQNRDYGVFGTGLNTDSQIGYHFTKQNAPMQVVISPSRIAMPFQYPSVTRVKQIACGRAHTFILTDKEGVFSLGNNSYGQCGRVIVENENYKNNPKINSVVLDEEIAEIVCGQDNTLFLTKNGEVLTCGWGADGQLGNGSYKNVWKPTKIGGDIAGEKIKQISCTADCVLAVSEKGDLFGWGNNEYGQVALNSDVPQVAVPRYIATETTSKIVQAAAGGTMCAVLNSDGQVFVWGYGILGMGPIVQHQPIPTPLPKPLFGYNEFNPSVKVETLSCSLTHFAAINSNGDLYTWGHNKHGCLGLAMKNDQFFPLKVAVPAKVTGISCGIDHTAVTCKTFI